MNLQYFLFLAKIPAGGVLLKAQAMQLKESKPIYSTA